VIDVVCADIKRDEADLVRLDKAYGRRQLAALGIRTNSTLNQASVRSPESIGQCHSQQALNL